MRTKNDLDTSFEQWKRGIEKLIREHPLHIISWEATRQCDMNCVHCGSPSEEVNLGDELTTEEVIAAFQQIAADFDMSQFRHINITGGEPFVRKDLISILKEISSIPFYRNIDIQTNGLFIHDNPVILKELKKYGVTGVGISIDGMEKTHDSFRRMAGSFFKTVKAAKLAVENGYVVTVSTVAHAKNVVELPELLDIVKSEIRPRVFRVMTIDPLGRTGVESEYLLSPDNVKEVIDFLKLEYQNSCKAYGDSSTTMVELGCGGWLGKELEGTFRPLIFHCIAGINNLGILFDGKLASCSNISRDFIEGDLRKDRIKNVWENRYRKYRELEWKKTGFCKTCDQWSFCHGGPMHRRDLYEYVGLCIFNELRTCHTKLISENLQSKKITC
ncbi:MAG: radical SAM protein [Sedimentisphaerales bacterium]